jgi:hypothetical protein
MLFVCVEVRCAFGMSYTSPPRPFLPTHSLCLVGLRAIARVCVQLCMTECA